MTTAVARRWLHIADDFTLPLDFMLRSAVIYGAPESGKTTTATVIAEEVWAQGQPFCVLDPKGDWYGVKASRDGRSAGIPAVVFGGDHADLPLEDGSGPLIARIVSELRQPAILDMEHMSKGRQIRFVASFLEKLYEFNRLARLLILDEAQRWAPQNPISPEHVVCLGAAEDVAKMGRKHGLGRLYVTQRGAGFNKEVAELMDVLVAHRTPGVLDQKRVAEWLDANIGKSDPKLVKEVMEGLARFRRGECVIASAHPEMTMFARVQIRDRTTFDSSATPGIGVRHVEPRVLAEPDLRALREQMAGEVERARADDPKLLRQRVRALTEEVEQAHKAHRRQGDKLDALTALLAERDRQLQTAPSPLFTADELSELTAKVLQVDDDDHERHHQRLGKALDQVIEGVMKLAGMRRAERDRELRPTREQLGQERPPAASAAAANTRNELLSTPSRSTTPVPDGSVAPAQQRILNTLAWLAGVGLAPASRPQVAFLVGLRPTSGGFKNYLGALRTAGLIDYPGPGLLTLTPAGEAAASPPDLPPTTEALQAQVLNLLGGSSRRILQILLAAYPSPVPRYELAGQVGLSPTSGGFKNYLGQMRTLGLVGYPSAGEVVALPVLFLDGDGR